MAQLLSRLLRLKLAAAFSLLCFVASAQTGYVPYAITGEACVYIEHQVTEWSEPGDPIVLPDTMAIMLGVQPGDALSMSVDNILQAAIFERRSSQPGCTWVTRRVGYNVYQYVP